MTNEEVIRIINGKAPLIIRDREGGICDKTDELKTTILSALEKQMPEAPVNKEEYDGSSNLTFVEKYRGKCPRCDARIGSNSKYCPDCGQRIDWEGCVE